MKVTIKERILRSLFTYPLSGAPYIVEQEPTCSRYMHKARVGYRRFDQLAGYTASEISILSGVAKDKARRALYALEKEGSVRGVSHGAEINSRRRREKEYRLTKKKRRRIVLERALDALEINYRKDRLDDAMNFLSMVEE